jgi:hypothetical protein
MKTVKRYVSLIIALMIVYTPSGFPQTPQSSQSPLLEKMPADLETDFALSALPRIYGGRPPFIC